MFGNIGKMFRGLIQRFQNPIVPIEIRERGPDAGAIFSGITGEMVKKVMKRIRRRRTWGAKSTSGPSFEKRRRRHLRDLENSRRGGWQITCGPCQRVGIMSDRTVALLAAELAVKLTERGHNLEHVLSAIGRHFPGDGFPRVPCRCCKSGQAKVHRIDAICDNCNSTSCYFGDEVKRIL